MPTMKKKTNVTPSNSIYIYISCGWSCCYPVLLITVSAVAAVTLSKLGIQSFAPTVENPGNYIRNFMPTIYKCVEQYLPTLFSTAAHMFVASLFSPLHTMCLSICLSKQRLFQES
ncbi:hypothetical protein CsSME_00043897 [Camellia sinensis var. sinensis]